MVSPLTLLLLTAMGTWVPMGDHRFYEPIEATVSRYISMAEDISHVVGETPGEKVRSVEFEALLLGSIASFESAYRNDVDTCLKSRGGAFSIFQIVGGGERSKRNVCSSRREAVRVALSMVRESFRVCHSLAFEDRLSFYTDGACHSSWWRSRSRVKRALDFELPPNPGSM